MFVCAGLGRSYAGITVGLVILSGLLASFLSSVFVTHCSVYSSTVLPLTWDALLLENVQALSCSILTMRFSGNVDHRPGGVAVLLELRLYSFVCVFGDAEP
jgi:hypothetical protein